ncbi:MAG: hypothetical protein H5T34_03945 [Candidatus Methanomethyliales bacterium]|nr:hypothetical protein [Candidatus Methanomethylicales archaeon]
MGYLGRADLLLVLHAAVEGCSVLITDDKRLIQNKTVMALLESIKEKTDKEMIVTDEL